jgi:DNA-binding transcriptional LysR family regulator
MNWNHLRAFYHTARSGSISRGAEALCVSQPAISRQIQDLEDHLQTQLLIRGQRGTRLTQAGELLQRYCTQLFRLEEEAARALRDLRDLKRGRLAIGASTTIGCYLLPGLLAEFANRHPGLELELEVANNEQIQRKLCQAELDVAFVEGYILHDQLQSTVFAQDRLILVAAPWFHYRSLSEHVLLLREKGSGTREVVLAYLERRNLRPASTLSIGHSEAIKRAVAAGAGVGILSESCVQDELRHGQLIQLRPDPWDLSRPLYRLQLRDNGLSPAALALITMLGQRMIADH